MKLFSLLLKENSSYTDQDHKVEEGFWFLLASRVLRSIAMIYVTLSLPLYLLLIGLKIEIVGTVLFFTIMVSTLISFTAGMMGDRIGYRFSLIYADIPLIIGTFLLFRYPSTFDVEIAAIVGGIGGASGGLRGVFAPGMNALIARNYPQTERRISRMGILMFAGSIASIGGSLLLYLGKYIMPSFTEAQRFRDIYLICMVFTILSIILVSLTYERPRVKKKNIIMSKSSGRYTGRVFLSNVVAGSGLGFGIVLLPAWLELRFGISSSYVGFIFTISYITTAIGSFVASRISLKVNPLLYSSISRSIQGIALIIMAFLPTIFLVSAVYIARQFLGGFGAPMRSAINVRGISSDDYGTASSLQGLGSRASQGTSAASGYLMAYSLPLPEVVGGAVQMFGGYLYYVLIKGAKTSIPDTQKSTL